MHLLDTDTLSHLYAGRSSVVERLRQLDDTEVAITVVTRIELLRGRHEFLLKAASGAALLRAQRWLAKTEHALSQLRIIPVDERVAERFDQLSQISRLRKIGRADLLIGSIALAYQAVLVSRNLRLFRQMPGLQFVNWVD